MRRSLPAYSSGIRTYTVREYWYTQPIRFAVREGHLDAVRVLLDAGADPSWRGLNLDRGAAYDLVIAAALGDLEHVRCLLDEDRDRIAATRPCGKRAPDWLRIQHR